MSASDLTIVVGAGVAGLTLAWRIASTGRQVLVLERNQCLGGLGGNFRYDDYIFDIGPHRFHTDDHAVFSVIREVLEDDFIVIHRNSAVYIGKQFLPWPLNPTSVRLLQPKMLIGAFLDFFRRKGAEGDTFDSYIISRYGETLYRNFFEPYTVKFLGMPCREISRDWAITGIDRAVIDGSSAVGDLLCLASSIFRIRKPLEFLYPASGGISVFSERLRKKVEAAGGTIILNSAVVGLEVNGDTVVVHTNSGSHSGGRLYWSGSLHNLAASLHVPPPGLEYLSMILFNYRISAPCRTPYQWIYFGEGHVPFNRVSMPTNFNPRLAPAGCSGLCVEITVREGQGSREDPMLLEPEVRRALIEVGLIGSSKDIAGVTAEKVRESYPVYRLGYRQEVEKFFGRLPETIIPFGRTGGFWYNNMDNSIAEAIQIAEGIGKGDT